MQTVTQAHEMVVREMTAIGNANEKIKIAGTEMISKTGLELDAPRMTNDQGAAADVTATEIEIPTEILDVTVE